MSKSITAPPWVSFLVLCGIVGFVVAFGASKNKYPVGAMAPRDCHNPYMCAALQQLKQFQARLLAQQLDAFRPFKTADWAKFKPVIACPPDRPLTKYGQGDGSKLLCKLDGVNPRSGSPCIIYSLGSNGDFQFEQAMLGSTACQIHTFDCTYEGSTLHPTRHHYHKWCIGTGEGHYRTWNNITATLGHERVDLLKMDIEGFEYSVLSSFYPEHNLPDETSLEFHVNVTSWSKAQAPESPAELGLAFLHLANLGYAAYSQEVNPIVPHCCCEFTFMRVKRHTPFSHVVSRIKSS